MRDKQENSVKQLNSTGIKLQFDPNHGWIATVDYSTWQHGEVECIEGSIGTRYFVKDLAVAIDRAKSAAEAIGVVFDIHAALEPCLYVQGDGEDSSVPLPVDWRQSVKEQSDRLGWKCVHDDETATTCEARSRIQ